MPCLNMYTLWFLDLTVSLEEMVQKILKLKKIRRIYVLKLQRSNDDDDGAKQNGFFCLDLLLLWIIMRSEFFWDPKFLRGIQTLKLGRSDDDDDAKQNGFFCYGSSWDGTKRTGSNTRWMLSCEPQVPHNTMAVLGFVCSFKNSFCFAVELT